MTNIEDHVAFQKLQARVKTKDYIMKCGDDGWFTEHVRFIFKSGFCRNVKIEYHFDTLVETKEPGFRGVSVQVNAGILTCYELDETTLPRDVISDLYEVAFAYIQAKRDARNKEYKKDLSVALDRAL